MNVLDAKMDWNLGYANPPKLKLLVDNYPEDLIYEKKGNLYFAHKEGYASFFKVDPNDHSGFGGRVFHIKVKEGGEIREVSLRGPWSSRPGVMNRYFHPHVVDVSYTNDPKVWERGYTFFGGAVSVPLAMKAIMMIPNAVLMKIVGKDVIEYPITRDTLGGDQAQIGNMTIHEDITYIPAYKGLKDGKIQKPEHKPPDTCRHCHTKDNEWDEWGSRWKCRACGNVSIGVIKCE